MQPAMEVARARAAQGYVLGRRLIRSVRKAPAHEWRAQVRRLPVDPDVVLYEAFFGRSMTCHPEAIFRELLDAPDLAHLRHVWVLNDEDDHTAQIAEFKDHPRVRFVRRGAMPYWKAVSTAGWLVNNSTFPPAFAKRPGQVYVNTWHGTPLKVMGYDEPLGIPATRNVLRNFLQADYLLSSGPYMTETMYASAYRLRNLFEGLVIEEGDPRTDRSRLSEAERERVRDRVRSDGAQWREGERLVLLAPTWSGLSFDDPRDDTQELADDVRELQSLLPPGHRVLLKVHQQVYATAAEHPALRELLVPNDIPTNEVLSVADVLVTDYSSIFFDFLPTGRPILVFTPHNERYQAERGVYFDTLPGPSAATVSGLARLVTALGSGDADDPLVTHGAAYRQAVEQFAAKDDGHASQRVVDIVWRGRRDGYAVGPLTAEGKPKILLYLGGMKSNGITSSALNLLRSLDLDRFDVTALYDHSDEPERLANAELIPFGIRRLARTGGFSPGKQHLFRRRRLLRNAQSMSDVDLATMRALLADERYRIFGDTSFDFVADFSGYSPFWSFLMLEVPATGHAVWQHNDLLADQQREVNGQRPHEANLGSVFASYAGYDELVSVSRALRDINLANLGDYAPADRFTWARNAIDVDRIVRSVAGDPWQRETWPSDDLLTQLAPVEDQLTAWDLAEQHRAPEYVDEIERRLSVGKSPRRPGVHQFVTVGRLSPEKNHERLIRAFAQVHQVSPDTRLVIIGDGPLRGSLKRLAKELGVTKSVVFAGQRANPWALMAECDTFVLSSDYEGQPMVILEARVVGLPVVATAFGSVAGAVTPQDGLVVERSVEALAEGMAAALRGEVPNPPFDGHAYNAEVVGEFLRAVGAEVPAGA